MNTENIPDLYASEIPDSDLVTLGVRIPKADREAFLELCTFRKTTASRVIRNFINRELKNNIIKP